MNLAKLIEFLRDRLKTVIWVSCAVLALVVLLDAIPAVVDKEHAHTGPEHWPAFWAVFGFLGCVVIILFSKWFGHLGIMTREDYYEDDWSRPRQRRSAMNNLLPAALREAFGVRPACWRYRTMRASKAGASSTHSKRFAHRLHEHDTRLILGAMTNFWLHPSLILILGALLLPLVPARLKKGYLLLIPILLFARILTMARGEFGQVHFLDWTLVFGRVDALSSVFGYIMSLMCILGTLYGLHVKDDAQHIASWFYVAGSIGCIYAGDFLTLFLFWELMAFSSVFLIWFRGRRESLGAGYRYLLVHVAGGVVLLAGIVLHCNAPGQQLVLQPPGCRSTRPRPSISS